MSAMSERDLSLVSREMPTEEDKQRVRSEWLERYKRRFMDVAGLSYEQATDCANAESFEVLADGYLDDPEGAADLEMSYWDGD